jgi:hypothetical protein
MSLEKPVLAGALDEAADQQHQHLPTACAGTRPMNEKESTMMNVAGSKVRLRGAAR